MKAFAIFTVVVMAPQMAVAQTVNTNTPTSRYSALTPLTIAGQSYEQQVRTVGNKRVTNADGPKLECLEHKVTLRQYCLTRAQWQQVAQGTLKLRALD